MKTTDYPKQIENDVAQHVLPLAEKYRLACERCQQIEKSIEQQQDAVDALRSRLDGLKGNTGLHDAEAIQNRMREKTKTEDELKMAERVLESLKNEALPPSVKARDQARAVCSYKILELMRQARREADIHVNAMLRAVIDEQNAFVQAFADVAQQCGVSLPLSDETLRPGILTGADILDIESRLATLAERERIEAGRRENNKPTPETPEPVQAAPSDTPLTGVSDQGGGTTENKTEE